VSTAAAALLARVGGNWQVFQELAEKPESKRRSILRSHREAKVVEISEQEFRQRVDDALDRLMLLELGFEIGILTDPRILDSIPGLRVLFAKNGSFVRYLDTYLSFSLRFVSTRLGIASTPPGDEAPTKDAVNDLPIGWPLPPIPESNARRAPADMLVYLETQPSLGGTNPPAVSRALDFLDDFMTFSNEHALFELWLRRLIFDPEHEPAFQQTMRGLWEFAEQRKAFYLSLEDRDRLRRWSESGRAQGTWSVRNPLTARFGLSDLYWLARLLRAEVSPSGVVNYSEESWLRRIASRLPEAYDPALTRADWDRAIDECEEVLRAVFDYTLDLVQNAVDNAGDQFERRVRPDDFPELPSSTVSWRVTCDEELAEISRQRQERLFYGDVAPMSEPQPPAPDAGQSRSSSGVFGWLNRLVKRLSTTSAPKAAPEPEWSRRIRTGEQVSGLVGLALSGGGIRSATFNLGVLQRMQELDLLRQIDYLSTVSGGGYIGAWLLASVKRTRYWLTRPTDWSPSVDHLRRFSNYLAPRTGLMSADTWSMWASWIRNALLIQASAFTWLAFLLVTAGIGQVFFNSSIFAWPRWDVVLVVALTWLAAFVIWCIKDPSHSVSETRVLWLAVVPAWACSFITSAMFWGQRPDGGPAFSAILGHGWRPWLAPLVFLFIGMVIAARMSIDTRRWRNLFSVLAGLASTGVVYLGLCGTYYLFGQWAADPDQGHSAWYAYTFGPPLVLLVMAVGVMLLIGLIGHASADWRREWWTRFGSWLGIYAVALLAFGMLTIFGPIVTLTALMHHWDKAEWTAVLGWLGTVVGGLLAGNSSQSDGEDGKTLKAQAIGWFARFAAFAFVVGAVLMASTAVHIGLVKIWVFDNAISAGNYWMNVEALQWYHYVGSAVVLVVLGALFSWRFEINVFGLNQFYRNRLARCYLGATRWVPGLRKPHKFTGFDQKDDLRLSTLRHHKNDETPYRGPFPLVNCSLNLGGSSDLTLHTRHSASFVLTPLRCGASRRAIGYAPSGSSAPGDPCFAGGVDLGQAISISGAAASPNMGYNTSPLVAFLLTMFNVRLAWWFPNPGKTFWSAGWLRFSLWYLVREIFASADERSYFVNVSDGGHFENLGIYELVRRRCKVIIACDAECDGELTFGSLGRAVRMCQTDFGACIDIDVESVRRERDSHRSRAHCAVGHITYANGSHGYLIYLKASMTGDEDVSVEQYHSAHPEFPHESTGDQFFDEEQFESYRRLGHHITEMTFRDVEREPSLLTMAYKLSNLWIPASAAGQGFVAQTEALTTLWDRLRTDDKLADLLRELHDLEPPAGEQTPNERELAFCLELIQLMENAFVELHLDEFWSHPDNRGWVTLFTMWARSPRFRAAYHKYKDVFGIRFVYFCAHRLGL